MEPQILSVIASAAVGFVSSFFAKAGEAAAKKVGEDIVQTLKARFAGKPVAQEALAEIQAHPDDSDRQAALRVQVKKALEEDEEFAAELQRLLKAAGATEAGATIIQQTAGDQAKQFGQVFGNVTIGDD